MAGGDCPVGAHDAHDALDGLLRLKRR